MSHSYQRYWFQAQPRHPALFPLGRLISCFSLYMFQAQPHPLSLFPVTVGSPSRRIRSRFQAQPRAPPLFTYSFNYAVSFRPGSSKRSRTHRLCSPTLRHCLNVVISALFQAQPRHPALFPPHGRTKGDSVARPLQAQPRRFIWFSMLHQVQRCHQVPCNHIPGFKRSHATRLCPSPFAKSHSQAICRFQVQPHPSLRSPPDRECMVAKLLRVASAAASLSLLPIPSNHQRM